MENCVFIQTNHKQITGAFVAQHALRRYSTHNDQFDVKIIEKKDYPYFDAREGQTYLRDGVKRVWLNDDLQSFILGLWVKWLSTAQLDLLLQQSLNQQRLL